MADRKFELYQGDAVLEDSDTAYQDLITVTVPAGEAVYIIWRVILTTGLTGSNQKSGSGTAHSYLVFNAPGASAFIWDPYSSSDEVNRDLSWGNQVRAFYNEDGVVRLQCRYTGTGTEDVRFIARAEVMRNSGPP